MDNTKQQTNEQVLAMSIVIILNWMIAHIATAWALPPEVQSAVQSSLVIMIGWYSRQADQRELRKQLQMVKSLGWQPPPEPAAKAA